MRRPSDRHVGSGYPRPAAANTAFTPLQTTIHVGADVAAPADALQQAALHGETRVFHGSVQDGIGAAEVIAYLQADAASLQNPEEEDGMSVDLIPEGLLLRFGVPMPPTVRLADGTPPALVDETVRVVQAINAALPIDWQLEVNRDPAPAGTVTPSEGEILRILASPIDENIGGTALRGGDRGPGRAVQDRDRRRPGLYPDRGAKRDQVAPIIQGLRRSRDENDMDIVGGRSFAEPLLRPSAPDRRT